MQGTDAITLLKQDHKNVKALFREFEKSKLNASKSQELAKKIFEELTLHTEMEERLFYPAVREAVEDTKDLLGEAFQEHHMVKICITELQGMDAGQELFQAKMTVLMENVRHHIEEEEEELFPKVREKLSRSVLQQLGGTMLQLKKATSPDPQPEELDEQGSILEPKVELELSGNIREILGDSKKD